ATGSIGADNWALWIAYVLPHSGGTVPADAGIYLADGTKTNQVVTNYRWYENTISAAIRSYLFYSGDVDEEQYFYRPRVDMINGSEPSIEQLLSGQEAPTVLSVNISHDGEIEYMVTETGAYDFIAKDYAGNTRTVTKTVYGITYQLNGGEVANTKNLYTVESNSITLQQPTKAGYDFGGWKVALVDGATVYKSQGVFASINDTITQIYAGSYGDITLFADWSFEATLTINTTFDSTVESGMMAFIKIVAIQDSNYSIWVYPLENGSIYEITFDEMVNIVITFINPTNHGSTSDGSPSFDIDQTESSTVLDITVSKTTKGYIYNSYYVN
ncbi:MAG: InlB B-repeat-containing protein, partial [Clostridia bacterium]|nr:InlB B-repeat-containing protein [Clostridia bacterium]